MYFSPPFSLHHCVAFVNATYCLAGCYLSLRGQICLVPNDHEREAFRVGETGGAEEVVLPLSECLEGLDIGDVIDENARVGPAVKHSLHTVVLLLSCRVPYLHRHLLVIENKLFR
eukprot:TRINITY_DN1209_c0_g3_i1.p2 TRINITY_DN1209_c0_g3~~TRINITY_DN1209_c0_g3_i1.p2  ORF type:complete len:115 (-),score=2.94 TRINITY_DN1209_c0_g3_i1:268-612(-)